MIDEEAFGRVARRVLQLRSDVIDARVVGRDPLLSSPHGLHVAGAVGVGQRGCGEHVVSRSIDQTSMACMTTTGSTSPVNPLRLWLSPRPSADSLRTTASTPP